jgi:hypothetical protein
MAALAWTFHEVGVVRELVRFTAQSFCLAVQSWLFA